jgi:Cdc6-like AAA superfamily ATPase
MQWVLTKSVYPVWDSYSLSIVEDIILKTGESYRLIGNNGTGKSSFIKKILIPTLQSNTEDQYIIYIEQQVQSQLNAIKSYSMFHNSASEINTVSEMILYYFNSLKQSIAQNDRPIIIILDECFEIELIESLLSEFNKHQYCLIYVSHSELDSVCGSECKEISFEQVNNQLSSVKLS